MTKHFKLMNISSNKKNSFVFKWLREQKEYKPIKHENISNIYQTLSVAYSSQGNHTGQLDFCNWLADDSTTG